jgi:hypothetical protein
MRRRPANLTLAPDRLRFGQRYAEANHTSLSQVVERLLGALEQTLNMEAEPAAKDPLDGLLAGWPTLDKKDLRRAQHEARLR